MNSVMPIFCPWILTLTFQLNLLTSSIINWDFFLNSVLNKKNVNIKMCRGDYWRFCLKTCFTAMLTAHIDKNGCFVGWQLCSSSILTFRKNLYNIWQLLMLIFCWKLKKIKWIQLCQYFVFESLLLLFNLICQQVQPSTEKK